MFFLKTCSISQIIFCCVVGLTVQGACAWDDNYSAEDDAKVIPIVLPIVGVVVLACIIGCCVQGGKCRCFKKDDEKEKKLPPELQGNTLGRSKLPIPSSQSENKLKSSRAYIQRQSQLPGYSQLHGNSLYQFQHGTSNQGVISRPPTRSQTLAKASDRSSSGFNTTKNTKTSSKEVAIGIEFVSNRAPKSRSTYQHPNKKF